MKYEQRIRLKSTVNGFSNGGSCKKWDKKNHSTIQTLAKSKDLQGHK